MIAYDSSANGSNVNPGTSLTWSHTCTGADRILFVFTRGGNSEGDKVTGATYAGVAMTALSQSVTTPGSAQQKVRGFYLLNPALGANNVVVSLTSGFLAGVSSSYTGVKQSGFPDSINTNTASSASSLTVSTTTVKNNSWTVLGAAGDYFSAGAGSTLRISNSSLQVLDSNGPKTPAGATSMAVNYNISDLGGIIVSFAPSIKGGAFLLGY